MSAELILKELLGAKQAKAIALVGTWGRGKTHFWRKLVTEQKGGAWQSYSYVSLFGINSLADLKHAIFEGGVDLKLAASQDRDPVEKTKVWFAKSWKSIAGRVSEVDTPWVGNLSAVFRAFAFSTLKERLVCIDDLERRGSELEVEDVLGLISFLCEERGCAVVLILNETTLEEAEADTWNRHREKVFHGEVTYKPAAEECIKLIFDAEGDDAWQDAARPVLQQLQVGNMRIIGRVKAGLEVLSSQFSSASTHLRKQLAASLAFLIYCHNASGEGAPSMEYALRNARFRSSLSESDDRSPEQKKWDAILDEIRFYPDDVDLALADMVRHGYPDIVCLRSAVENREEMYAKYETNSEYSDAWRCYHDSFEDDSGGVIQKFEKSFQGAAPGMNAMNANSTISLMRSLDRDDLAEQFIVQWIEPRRGVRRDELQIREAEVFGPITDEPFRKAIVAASQQERSTVGVDEALEQLSTGMGDLWLALDALGEGDVIVVIEWLRANPGEKARELVRRVESLGGSDPRYSGARALLVNALRQISQTSTINKLRTAPLISSLGGVLEDA